MESGYNKSRMGASQTDDSNYGFEYESALIGTNNESLAPYLVTHFELALSHINIQMKANFLYKSLMLSRKIVKIILKSTTNINMKDQFFNCCLHGGDLKMAYFCLKTRNHYIDKFPIAHEMYKNRIDELITFLIVILKKELITIKFIKKYMVSDIKESTKDNIQFRKSLFATICDQFGIEYQERDLNFK